MDRYRYINFDGSILSAQASSVAEAKLAIKECKMLKKELALEKKEVSAELAAVRSGRSQSLGNRRSTMRGGGEMGQFVRTIDRFFRDRERASHANTVAPYEKQKQTIDSHIRDVDKLILKLEQVIVDYELEAVANNEPSALSSPLLQCPTCGSDRGQADRFCGECGTVLA
jgi:hypothetical protein